MKNKILLGIVVILSIISIVVINFKSKNNHSFLNNDKIIKIKDENNNIKNLKIEEYLVGVLAAEMPASFELEALKAQAVAARTYALYKIEHSKNQDYNILTTITDQSFITEDEMHEKWGDDYTKYSTKIKQAINDTKDEVMYYNDKIIEAFYFAMSNGFTEKASSVFKEDLPYLESVASKWDNENLNNFHVTKEFSFQDFCTKLSLTKCNTIEINQIEKKNTLQRTSKTKSWFFEIINKIDKPLAKLTKGPRGSIQINKSEMERDT